MLLSEFDYELPESSIGVSPAEPRDSARLLDTTSIDHRHRRVRELDQILLPDDVVVVNHTKVLPSRVKFHRRSGGSAELLVLEQRDDRWWECLVRPSAKLRPGAEQVIGGVLVTFGEDLGEGRRLVRFDTDRSMSELLSEIGEVPLPPYLSGLRLEDSSRYQTVYAHDAKSAAAPTAGLHLTTELLDRMRTPPRQVLEVELVVGLGTFRPITVDELGDHQMHAERYQIDTSVWGQIIEAKRQGRRIVAVGTTTVRALESAARSDCLSASTDIFIKRGFEWKIVDVLMTNFHLPKSSLLVMLDAFMGPSWRDTYREAMENGYAMLSFGDAMLAQRNEGV